MTRRSKEKQQQDRIQGQSADDECRKDVQGEGSVCVCVCVCVVSVCVCVNVCFHFYLHFCQHILDPGNVYICIYVCVCVCVCVCVFVWVRTHLRGLELS